MIDRTGSLYFYVTMMRWFYGIGMSMNTVEHDFLTRACIAVDLRLWTLRQNEYICYSTFPASRRSLFNLGFAEYSEI